ncbi:MAG: hypothetical protein ACREJO_00100 [Phycisphaerales bacterium]
MKRRLDIARLYQGVSQQPPWRRQVGQVEESINYQLDVLEGARKRNATELIAELSLPSGNYYWTTLRDKIVAIGNSSIYAFDRSGTRVTIEDQTGGFGYLSGITPATTRVATAIDTLVVCNTGTTVTTTATATFSVTQEVRLFSDLPDSAHATIGGYYKVKVDENFDLAGHYYWSSSLEWIRVAAPADADGSYTATTMPHRLVYDETHNKFVFSRCPWKDRLSGNTRTNKTMPFVGSTVQAVAFHSARLFLMARTAVCSGGSGPNQSVFNLFTDNISAVVDSDPISIDINLPNIGKPLDCCSLGNELFIDCENGQLAFGSADKALAPANGRVRKLGDYKSMGKTIANSGPEAVIIDQYGDCYLYRFADVLTGVQLAGNLNTQSPTYVPSTSINRAYFIDSTLFVGQTGADVYVHERFASGGEVIQLAWSKYTFFEQTVHIDAWQNYVYLVQTDGSHFSLLRYRHKILETTTGNFDVRFDRREYKTATSYDALNNETLFVVTGRTPASSTGWYVASSDGLILPVSRVSGTNLYVNGKHNSGSFYVGKVYTASMTLSKIWATNDVRSTLSRIVVGHKDTTDYVVTMGRANSGVTRSSHFNGVRSGLSTINGSLVDTGIFQTMAGGDARYTDITISNATPGTVTLSFVELQVQQGAN